MDDSRLFNIFHRKLKYALIDDTDKKVIDFQRERSEQAFIEDCYKIYPEIKKYAEAFSSFLKRNRKRKNVVTNFSLLVSVLNQLVADLEHMGINSNITLAVDSYDYNAQGLKRLYNDLIELENICSKAFTSNYIHAKIPGKYKSIFRNVRIINAITSKLVLNFNRIFRFVWGLNIFGFYLEDFSDIL